MIYKRIGNIQFTTSWDDGSSEDLKLAKMLDSYGFPATFYVAPGYNKYGFVGATNLKKMSRNPLFEIGGHTLNHIQLPTIEKKHQYHEILYGKKYLERMIQKNILSFCYPRGKYTDETVECVKLAGFTEARTVDVMQTRPQEDCYRIKTSIHVYPDRKEYKGDYWLDVAKRLWKDPETEYFHLWGHSWEITKFDMWDELKKFFDFVTDYENKENEKTQQG